MPSMDKPEFKTVTIKLPAGSFEMPLGFNCRGFIVEAATGNISVRFGSSSVVNVKVGEALNTTADLQNMNIVAVISDVAGDTITVTYGDGLILGQRSVTIAQPLATDGVSLATADLLITAQRQPDAGVFTVSCKGFKIMRLQISGLTANATIVGGVIASGFNSAVEGHEVNTGNNVTIAGNVSTMPVALGNNQIWEFDVAGLNTVTITPGAVGAANWAWAFSNKSYAPRLPNAAGLVPVLISGNFQASQPINNNTFMQAAIDVSYRQGTSNILPLYVPDVFRQILTLGQAAGNPVTVWTPGAGAKFRLLKYRIEGTADIKQAVAGDITLSIYDAATQTVFQHNIFVPAAAGGGVGMAFQIENDLLGVGFQSAAANNALKFFSSNVLTGGGFNVQVMGTEF